MYQMIKISNNNGLLVLDRGSDRGIILLGNGIGFGHKTDEWMESPGGAKRYELVSRQVSALQQMNSIDPVFIKATGKITRAAKFAMGLLSHDILIPMADYVTLAVNRARESKGLPDPFRYGIKALFTGECRTAIGGIGIIGGLAGVSMSGDKVGYITLHIHTGLSKRNMAAVMEIVRLVQGNIRLIKKKMDSSLASDTLGYNRLVSHIRCMIARTRKGEQADLDVEDYAEKGFPRTCEMADHVCQNMERRLGVKIMPEKRGLLAIHIQRVMQA